MVLFTDRLKGSPTFRARFNSMNCAFPPFKLTSYAFALSSDVVSPEDTTQVRVHELRSIGDKIRIISPVCPPEPRRTIMLEPLTSFNFPSSELLWYLLDDGRSAMMRRSSREAGRRTRNVTNAIFVSIFIAVTFEYLKEISLSKNDE